MSGTGVESEDNPISWCLTPKLAADRAIGEPWVRKLWDLEFSEGRHRYYSGLRHFLALLQVSDHFRVHGPVER